MSTELSNGFIVEITEERVDRRVMVGRLMRASIERGSAEFPALADWLGQLNAYELEFPDRTQDERDAVIFEWIFDRAEKQMRAEGFGGKS